ncbi:hypothetical protein FRC10_000521 [Ceratobasidium sp. 414]|nr:hypothetical protein FRC10_000521 [Ceratobasidium sp. 414]
MAGSLCKTKTDKLLSQSLSTVLRIVLHLNKTTSPDKSQYRKLSKKFSKACQDDAGLWIARLDAESGANRPLDSELASCSPVGDLPEMVDKLWVEAREEAKERPGEEDLLVDLWSWGIRYMPESSRRVGLWKAILLQSLSHTSTILHPMLLLRRLYDESQPPSTRALLVKELVARYQPSISFFSSAMDRELELLLTSSSEQVSNEQEEPPRKKRKGSRDTRVSPAPTNKAETACLEALYTAWRVIPDQNSPAALKWATSLLKLGEEVRANDAIVAVGGSKGRLKHEWEKLHEEISEGRAGSNQVESKNSGVAEPDIALENVEFT